MRAGLDAAGWDCLLAIDHDPDAVAVHRLAHGDAMEADVTKLSGEDIPDADVWAAGFPCQPFSSSGTRLGFGHQSGNVFSHLAQLVEECQPPILLLENVRGLLTNKSGHTLTVILSKLTSLGYSVSWLLVDLNWFGVPQTRERLFLIAERSGVICPSSLTLSTDQLPGIDPPNKNILGNLIRLKNLSWKERARGSLVASEERLRPAIGKPRAKGECIFGAMGNGSADSFVSYDVTRQAPKVDGADLGEIVAPNFHRRDLVRSIRFWTTDSGRGPTKLYLRSEPVSHCIGTSLGGAPLFAIPLKWVKKASDRAAFLEFSNWHREQDGLLVMRLRPCQAVKLFGNHTDDLLRALTDWDVGDTRKYKVVGNMVAPVCAQAVAETINEQLSPSFSKSIGYSV